MKDGSCKIFLHSWDVVDAFCFQWGPKKEVPNFFVRLALLELFLRNSSMVTASERSIWVPIAIKINHGVTSYLGPNNSSHSKVDTETTNKCLHSLKLTNPFVIWRLTDSVDLNVPGLFLHESTWELREVEKLIERLFVWAFYFSKKFIKIAR